MDVRTGFPRNWRFGAFAWADLDQDGDPDAAMIDRQGRLVVLANERQGRFKVMPTPSGESLAFLDITVSDSNSDGRIEILALTDTGQVQRITLGIQPELEILTETDMRQIGTQIVTGDLDNNGGVDIILTSRDGRIYFARSGLCLLSA